MDVLVMCGGRGTRFGAGEKPLQRIAGRPVLDRVLTALAGATTIDSITAGVSPHAPQTACWIDETAGVSRIDTPGDGYVADLTAALRGIDRPVMTVAADLPLLTPASIDRLLDRYAGGSMAVAVPTARKRSLGVSIDDATALAGCWHPTGINVVGRRDTTQYKAFDSIRLAVNMNRPRDAWIAERLLEVLNDGA